jgi:hypothetical protein
MALSTLTSSLAVAGVQPRAVHAGVNVQTVQLVGSSRTLSDIIKLMKIPNGATVIDVYGMADTGEGQIVFKLGTNSSETAFGTHTISATANPASFAPFRDDAVKPYKVSLSDDAVPQHEYLEATVSSGSWTTSFTIVCTVLYTMEPTGF